MSCKSADTGDSFPNVQYISSFVVVKQYLLWCMYLTYM